MIKIKGGKHLRNAKTSDVAVVVVVAAAGRLVGCDLASNEIICKVRTRIANVDI